MEGVTEGFEEYAEIDLRSYELKKFGSLLAKANYNVVELVFEAPTVMNWLPLEMDAPEELIRGFRPLNVPPRLPRDGKVQLLQAPRPG